MKEPFFSMSLLLAVLAGITWDAHLMKTSLSGIAITSGLVAIITAIVSATLKICEAIRESKK